MPIVSFVFMELRICLSSLFSYLITFLCTSVPVFIRGTSGLQLGLRLAVVCRTWTGQWVVSQRTQYYFCLQRLRLHSSVLDVSGMCRLRY